MSADRITRDDIPRYTDGDRTEVPLPNGWKAIVRVERDNFMGEPWKEHDGHGIVSEWEHRDKQPGERVLVADRGGARRFYDVAATMLIARKDGWGCGDASHTHKTDGERAACAVDRDYDRMRAWCRDEWEWITVSVTLKDADGETVEPGADASDSLSGIESDGDYWRDVAAELINELAAGLCLPGYGADRATRECGECGSLGSQACAPDCKSQQQPDVDRASDDATDRTVTA